MNMKKDEFKDRELFESAIRALEAEIANAGAHLTIDSAARQAYTKQILVMSNELRSMAFTGQITWAKAAEQANEARNTIMSIIRSRSTPVGLAIAESIKQEGKTLNELVARKTVQLFGSGAVFDKLPVEKQNKVFAEIVTAAGKSRPEVTATMMKLSYAGRGLIFLSIAMSVYTIATAENKVDAAGKEVAVTGASIAGGMAGGALAGLACGPGAPVCVTVGAFIGGGLAAFGMSVLW